MQSGFKIGSIAGIKIYIDWSWLIIFFLVSWNLAGGFAQFHADWSPAVRWVIAIVAALLFFGSILLHELAHSLVAQAQGTPVSRITLFLFGGVSNIQRNPESAGKEFLMAIVGPLTSIVLGIALAVLAGLTTGPLAGVMANPARAAVSLGPAATLLGWLGSINIVVGLFNLIPGFPLDGGRVVRSILWAITGSLRTATLWATSLGRGIAWLMIGLGVLMIFGYNVPFFGTGFIGGIWLAFIGWFLNSAADQSFQQVVVRDALEGVPVSRLMRTEAVAVSPNATIEELVHDHIMRSDDQSFPVSDDGALLGIITLDDVRAVPRDQWPTTRVGERMTPADKLAVASPTDDAAEAFSQLVQRDVRQLPVVSGGKLVGVLRARDVVRWLHLHEEFGNRLGDRR